MKCRYCSADTRVLDTREKHEFLLVRRRRCGGPSPHTFETAEVLRPFLSKLAGTARRQNILDSFSRLTGRYRLALERREEIKKRMAAGEKQVFIAAAMGVSLDTVRVHARALRNGAPGKIGRPRKVRA